MSGVNSRILVMRDTFMASVSYSVDACVEMSIMYRREKVLELSGKIYCKKIYILH